MSARSLFLTATLIALSSTAVFEARVILRQREELRRLQLRIAEGDRDALRMHKEGEVARRELATAERELAGHRVRAPLDAATEARRKETNGWLVRVKQLKRLFDERPEQRIPEMQLLTDEDWLRVAKRASFDDEHATRKALGELRSSAKHKFFSRLAPALRAFARTAEGEPPLTIHALARHFDQPVDAGTLQRYEILKGNPRGGPGGPELIVREKDPIDSDFDSRTEATAAANGNGGMSGMNPPYAWLPDFRERMQSAYRAYAEANNGARPAGIVQALPYFNPPLDPEKIELIRRFERERLQ